MPFHCGYGRKACFRVCVAGNPGYTLLGFARYGKRAMTLGELMGVLSRVVSVRLVTSMPVLGFSRSSGVSAL